MSFFNYSTLRRVVFELPGCFTGQRNVYAALVKTPDRPEKIAEGGIRLQGKYKADTKEKPLITIVTAVYNGAEFLEQTIKSVLDQSYDNVEYIVVDGGSTDATLSIIKKYEDAIDYWVSEPDAGVYDAMNKGISLAAGSWVGLINADDYYSPVALDIVVNSVGRRSVDIVCGGLDIVGRLDGMLISHRKANYLKLPFGMYVNHPACFVRSAVYKKHWCYDSSLKIAADYKFFLMSYVSRLRFYNVPSRLAVMRDGGLSIRQEQLTKQEELAVRKEVLPYFLYLLVVLVKKLRRRG